LGEAVPLAPNALPAMVDALFASRRSTRRFSLGQVSTQSLSGLLEVLRIRPDGTRNYASASALYPVDLYIAVKPGHVEGVDAGSFLYDPIGHALHCVSRQRPGRDFFAPSNAPVFEEAAFVFLLAAHLEMLEERYGARGWHLATLEAGLMSQTLDVAAPACGLGLCQIGGADEAAVERLLGLEHGQRFIHASFGGLPDEQAGAIELTEEARLLRHIERVRRLSSEETATLRDAYRQDSRL
jgi:SagB-type dehydrogenase family enzyme